MSIANTLVEAAKSGGLADQLAEGLQQAGVNHFTQASGAAMNVDVLANNLQTDIGQIVQNLGLSIG